MQRASWVEVSPQSDFSIHNFPFGVAQTPGGQAVVSRIGDTVVDLPALADAGLIDTPRALLSGSVLNPLMRGGREVARQLRQQLMALFDAGDARLRDNTDLRSKVLFPAGEVTMLLPIAIGDYTDFYSSREHATNVGTMFRDPKNALLPNWLHLPVGYHGRASSIVVSGTPIHRPKGQTRPDDQAPPVFGPTKQLDFELEMAFVVGGDTELGEAIPVATAEDYIFGVMLFNDWSARDIQKWEYQPLGPFLAKNFASTISPWVVTLDALEPFRVSGPNQDPKPLPYLSQSGTFNLDVNLEVGIGIEGHEPLVVTRSNAKYLYWSMAQQLAHHTVNGCNVRTGDLMASGTISGPTPDTFGSMLELSWKGTKPLTMPDGTTRTFLNDGDTVIMHGWAERDGIRVGFGEARGKVLAE
jgi:fumarylacetoacetase